MGKLSDGESQVLSLGSLHCTKELGKARGMWLGITASAVFSLLYPPSVHHSVWSPVPDTVTSIESNTICELLELKIEQRSPMLIKEACQYIIKIIEQVR